MCCKSGCPYFKRTSLRVLKTYIFWRNWIHWQCVLDGIDIDTCWAQSTVVFQPRYCITCWPHWYFFKWLATTTSRLTFVQCESKRKFFQFGEFYLQNWNKIIMIPFFIVKYNFSKDVSEDLPKDVSAVQLLLVSYDFCMEANKMWLSTLFLVGKTWLVFFSYFLVYFLRHTVEIVA